MPALLRRHVVTLALAGLLSPCLTALGDDLAVSADDWSKTVWTTAREGRESDLFDLLRRVPEGDAIAPSLRESALLLNTNVAKREELRAQEIEKVSKELDEELAKERTDANLSKALRAAVELFMLSTDKPAFMTEPRTIQVTEAATAAAHAAEARGDWLTANELYFRLNALHEDSRQYKEDLERQGERLSMIRLYTPQRFWDLRNARRVADGEEALPAYNPTADDFREKLSGISEKMVRRAIVVTASNHVARVDLARLLIGGMDSLRTMLSTPDLSAAFSGMASESARAKFLAAIDEESARLRGADADLGDFDSLMAKLSVANEQTVKIDRVAWLHEFGNGAMGTLVDLEDEFSAIIWPDEIRNFQRTTRGSFVGIGVQIQLDATLSKIQVVTPLEGTPAHHAGIAAGDVITRINGISTAGFTLDQAVDVITGPAGTKVAVVVEREEAGQKREMEFAVPRALIDIPTVKGWKRTSAREDQWEWFIDADNGIGYVRLTQFTEKTHAEFDEAVRQMRRHGLNGLILDLRFNPGGLLDEAVEISNRFISKGLIVATKDGGDHVDDEEIADPRDATLSDVPVVVLINEGSASASEIVSGALQVYAHQKAIDALLIGERSFGKGSVQKVWELPGSEAALKVTTQYYMLPDQRIIHRKPRSLEWGVRPDLRVEMLPGQISKALNDRRDADIVAIDKNRGADSKQSRPDPDLLIAEGTDLQLQTALVLLQSRAAAGDLLRGERPVAGN